MITKAYRWGMRLSTDGFKIIYDPIAVKSIERQLGRPLDDYEKSGDKSVWINNRLTFLSIPKIVFPHDLIPNVMRRVK